MLPGVRYATIAPSWRPRGRVLDLRTMACKPSRRMRLGVAAASWLLAAWLAEGMFGADIGRAGHKLERRIELQLQLKGGAPPPQAPTPPERSHEDSIEPWELISV